MEAQTTTIFTGEYRHTLDDKNRFTIPSAWRSSKGVGSSFLTIPQKDADGNRFIAVITPEKLATIRAKAEAIGITNIKHRQKINRFISKVADFSYDGQGRTTLSAEQRQHAGITREVVFVGSLDNFYIYNPETWERISQPEEDDNDILAELGI